MPKDRTAKPIKLPNPPKGTPLKMKKPVNGISEKMEIVPKVIEKKETINKGFTENAKIATNPLDNTVNKSLPSHLDLPANRLGLSIVILVVLNPAHADNPRIKR